MRKTTHTKKDSVDAHEVWGLHDHAKELVELLGFGVGEVDSVEEAL